MQLPRSEGVRHNTELPQIAQVAMGADGNREGYARVSEKGKVKAMTTVNDWIDYLKWHLEYLQREHQTHIRISFAFGTVLIGSILAIASGIHSTNWLMSIIGIIGTVIFGPLLYFIINIAADLTHYTAHMQSILSDVIIGKLKDPKEILMEYRRVLDKMSKKYKRLGLRELPQEP